MNMNHMTARKKHSAVALEYILIAALVAIGLVAAFVSFRDSLSSAVEEVGSTTETVVSTTSDEALEAVQGTDDSSSSTTE